MDSVKDDKKADLIQQRKEQILTAAKPIFAKNGYRCTKVEQIADALNIGKGTIYRYFPDKKTLFLSVFKQGCEQIQKRFAANVHPITDPPIKVAAAIRNFFEFFDKNRDFVEIMMQVRSEFRQEHREIFMAVYSNYIVMIQNNLRNGIKMGIFRDLDVEKTAEAMSSTLHGVLQNFYMREIESGDTKNAEKASLLDRIEPVTQLILNGLKK